MVFLAALTLTACGSSGVDVINVHVPPDDSALYALVDACDDHVTVKADASPDRVSLSASVPRTFRLSHSDCQTEVLVPLAEPLAGRAVIDTATGSEVPVLEADGHEDWG